MNLLNRVYQQADQYGCHRDSILLCSMSLDKVISQTTLLGSPYNRFGWLKVAFISKACTNVE